MGEKNEKTPVYKKWWFWTIIILLVAAAGGVGMANKSGNNALNSQSSQTSQASNTTPGNPQNNNAVKPGENFEFDGLTLNVSPNYSFTTLNNEFSEDNGKTIVVLPITITNNSDEPKNLNLYSYRCYGAEGVELKMVSSYFMDDSADYAGKLQPGASYTKNLYLIYDGNGTYKIDFGYFSVDKSLSIEISK